MTSETSESEKEFCDEELSDQSSINHEEKELNVLVIGQSGVGKSTWINSLVNYLTYSTFEDARTRGPITVIPMTFWLQNDDADIKRIFVGTGEDEDDDKCNAVGASATQNCRTYQARTGGVVFNIIDTPGIGDTRGLSQDRINIQLILDHIKHLEYLHGICILLQANETRITTLFQFCINELLTHLHKSASENIIFCFTKSRPSCFTPGDTLSCLKTLLKSIDVNLNLENRIACFDNEAYKYLCTANDDFLERSEYEIQIYKASWNWSEQETTRVLEIIENKPPHKIKDTLTLNFYRNMVQGLSRPLAEITHNLEYNINATTNFKRSIETFIGLENKLREKLYHPGIVLKTTKIPFPRIVCTNTTCAKQYDLGETGLSELEYPQICVHKCTKVRDTSSSEFIKEKIRKNSIFRRGVCSKCNCSWDKHTYMFYEKRREVINVMDSNIAIEIQSIQDSRELRERLLKLSEDKIRIYKKEKEEILKSAAKFGQFLKQNSITPYNDSVSSYLQYLISAEENKNKTEADVLLLQQLKRTKELYEEEVIVLEESLKGSEKPKEITTTEVHQINEKLYKLDVGPQIKEVVDVTKEADQNVSSSLMTKIMSVIRWKSKKPR